MHCDDREALLSFWMELVLKRRPLGTPLAAPERGLV